MQTQGTRNGGTRDGVIQDWQVDSRYDQSKACRGPGSRATLDRARSPQHPCALGLGGGKMVGIAYLFQGDIASLLRVCNEHFLHRAPGTQRIGQIYTSQFPSLFGCVLCPEIHTRVFWGRAPLHARYFNRIFPQGMASKELCTRICDLFRAWAAHL